MRTTIFANEEYYHIYNRGVDKREVFLGEKDYLRFLETIRFVNDWKIYSGLSDCKRKSADRPQGSAVADPWGQQQALVDVICYCLNPNHFHFILKQRIEKGISLFMGRLSNSYSKYFNTKNSRSGSLFQGPFKSIHIDSNEYLLYLSAYVNANHFIHGYRPLGSVGDWPYSSLLDYLDKRNGTLSVRDSILEQFNDTSEYAKFVQDNALYLKEKKETEKYILE